VFNVIGGLVIETGGMTCHGSCLAREYRLPAVQLPGPLKLIPDGASTWINGVTGEIIVHDHPDAPERDAPADRAFDAPVLAT
jgi:pyruvate,water dikinase